MNSSLTVLYFSETRPYLADDLESHGWTVLRADSVMEVLAKFITYQPRAVVLAGDSDGTRDVLYHLVNVTAPSAWGTDHVFWLGEFGNRPTLPSFIRLRVLPPTATTYALESELNEIAGLIPA